MISLRRKALAFIKVTSILMATLLAGVQITSAVNEYDHWADVNADGKINVLDLISIIPHLDTAGIPLVHEAVENVSALFQEIFSRIDILNATLLTKDYSDHAINYLWREAYRQIKGYIHEIVAIGYSLPATDFASETLLRTGLHLKQREISFTLVNPDLKVFDRFSKIFAPSKMKLMRSIDEYLDAL